MKSVYAVVYEAQQQAIKCVKRGVNCGDVDTMARNHIEQNGYGTYFTHRVGHGLGLDIHESPYLVETNPKPLVSGNIITVEPGIYFPGDFGIRIEENVLVTDDGCEVLSSRAPSLVELYA
jgi:Xaa-Pro aminopeptidase